LYDENSVEQQSIKRRLMFISLDETKLYTTSFGRTDAPPILFLSGWIGSWEDWADTISVLSQDWRTIAYDHRGTGATVAPLESINLETMVTDVFRVLDHYQIERCVLAAMSAGAGVALTAALQHPERFTGLVLSSSMDFRKGAQPNHPFLDMLEKNYDSALNYFAAACVPELNSEHIRRWGRQILNRASPDAAQALFQMARAIDLRTELPNMNLRTLVLHGDLDSISLLESAQWLAETLPNASFELVSGTGHVPIMTKPEEVARHINTFFGI
jgi:pimeloyl-ACP methyl ester carboxylesterase